MSNRQQLMICIVLGMSLLLSPVTLVATQSTPATSDWASLRSIPTDARVSVKLKTGKTVEGKLKSVSDSSITVINKSAPVEVKREDVASVYQLMKKSATAATLIGAGIGAAARAGLGAAAASTDNGGFEKIDHAVTAGLAVVGAGAGAITGYLLGKRATKRLLVFESK